MTHPMRDDLQSLPEPRTDLIPGETPEEKLRFSLLVGLFVGRFDTVLEYRKRGMVDDAYVSTHANTIRRIFENPGVREWWSSGINTGFTARVKEWIETNAAA